MTIIFEKWPRQIQIFLWNEPPHQLVTDLDQNHRVSDLNFLDVGDAQTFLRDLAADPAFLTQLRIHTNQLLCQNDETVITEFSYLLANGTYRARQYDFYGTAWRTQPPPSPLPPPIPGPSPKPPGPPKPPVENKAVLVEFVEIINRGGVDGVVRGAGPASSGLDTLTTRTDTHHDGAYKQYINIVNKDCDSIVNSHPEYGRFIEIQARVFLDGKPKEGESVEFSYIRTAGEFCPALLKEDSAGFGAPGGSTKHSETTYSDGWTTTVKFYFSAYAGDSFELFAKGPDGKQLKLGSYQVWRKVWYQITKLKNTKLPSLTQAKKSFEDVFVQIELADVVEISKADAPAGSLYPAWMVDDYVTDTNKKFPPEEKALLIGTHNDRKFYSLLKERKNQPVKLHVILCNAIWKPMRDSAVVEEFILDKYSEFFDTGSINDMDVGLFKPTLDGKPLVINGSWSGNGMTGILTDDNILIEQKREFVNEFWIALPAEAPDPKIYSLKIMLQLRTANRFAGGYSKGVHIMMVDHLRMGDKIRREWFNRTLVHELGHSVNQVPLPGFQPKPLPPHPNSYSEEDYPEREWHCKTGATEIYVPVDNGNWPSDWEPPEKLAYTGGTCIMFAGGTPRNFVTSVTLIFVCRIWKSLRK